MKYLRYKEIEDIAENRVSEYSTKFNPVKEPPVPLDMIIELLFQLSISWEEIEDDEAMPVWGGLRPAQKEIVLNEKHLALFKEKPGFERSTKAHELGHWDLFLDKASLNCPLLPGFEKTDFFIKRSAKKGMVQVIRNAWADPNSYNTISSVLKSIDSPSVASAVNKYASVISMPHFLLSSAAKDFDLTHWPSLYRLAELFDVTISALTVRLQ